MGKIVIQDTADVYIEDITTGKVVLNAEAQLAGIAGSISEEDLRGGIGNGKIFKIRSDKDITLTMRSAVADMEYWAMTQGVAVDETGTATVDKFEKVKVTDNAGALEITLTKAKAGLTTARLNDLDGSQEEVAVTTNKITVPVGSDLKAGDETFVFWKEAVTGRSISIDSTKFSSKYAVTFRTIAYDVSTAKVISDIYFIFPETLPSAEFDISLENGSVYTPEITFSALTPLGETEIGKIIDVPRA